MCEEIEGFGEGECGLRVEDVGDGCGGGFGGGLGGKGGRLMACEGLGVFFCFVISERVGFGDAMHFVVGVWIGWGSFYRCVFGFGWLLGKCHEWDFYTY